MGSQGLNLPSYMERITVDDLTMYYYDSRTKGEVPCPEWLNTTEGRQHWEDIYHISLGNSYRLASGLQSAIQQFNQTGSSSHVNTYQSYTRCDLYPDGTQKSVYISAFNGKDFLSFDADSLTLTASVPQAVVYKRQKEKNVDFLRTASVFYKKTCFERLRVFLQHSPAVNTKKVPEVHLFKRTKSGSTVLTCHVTGFYPRDVQVEWTGAGLQSVDEELIGVLPNGDDTYQTRRSVIRPAENPEGQAYSCVVRHSSVPGNITKTWEEDVGVAGWIWIVLICVFLVIAGTGLLRWLRWFRNTKDAGS
ncbi:hypothetical protein NFI96_015869 [Prochilodus magdalenae]|nr:hypothetical protein NFI96_015869 [Prochilodus magdalenae]